MNLFRRNASQAPRRALAALALAALALPMSWAPASAGASEPGMLATPVWDMPAEEWTAARAQVESAVLSRFARRSSNFEILRLSPVLPPAGQPWGEQPEEWSSLVYDYAAEQAAILRLDARGEILSEEPYKSEVFSNQPPPSEGEFQNAVQYLMAHPAYGPAIADGRYEVYEAMPPVDYAPGAPRTLHVGLQPTDGSMAHEIVGVKMREGEVSTYRSNAPIRARARRGACGPSSGGGCPFNDTGSGILHVEWPQGSPVWEFDVVRPSRTDEGQTSAGAGVELRDLRYNGELILVTAHVPVLNVKYDDDACGPFRDWLFSESCMDVSGGSEVQPGFYRSNNVTETICVDGTDAGNFEGVGIQDTATELVLVSEMSAGWYRYLVGWRLKDNGDIQAEFFYAGTFNSCTCEPRTHHAYWRFDFALSGTADGGAPGGFAADNVFQSRPDTATAWSDVTQEADFLRAPTGFDSSNGQYRVINPTSGTGYEFIPTKRDATADGDPYGKADLWLLKWKSNELYDTGSFDTSINLSSYYSSPETVANERLVVWYGGHLRQTGGESGGANTCSVFGPRLLRRENVQVPVTVSSFSLGQTLD